MIDFKRNLIVFKMLIRKVSYKKYLEDEIKIRKMFKDIC